MKNLTPDEVYSLELLKKDNFRSVTKENADNLLTILGKLDPEVAKDLIEQMPEAIKGIVDIERFYSDLLTKGFDSCASSADSCFNTEDKIVDALVKEVEKDIPFEQKQYYVDHMVGAAVRKEKKDTEHRATVDKFLSYALMGFGAGLCLVAGLFLGGNGGRFHTQRH